jgi:exportin-1
MVDELGEVVKVKRDSTQVALYKQMRSTLVFLTHLDQDDTRNIMITKLNAQMDGSEYSRDNLCTLCWSIGSISGAFGSHPHSPEAEDFEKRFLVTVIRDLLTLTEMKRGKEHKAMIAGNIMYIVGQVRDLHLRLVSAISARPLEVFEDCCIETI